MELRRYGLILRRWLWLLILLPLLVAGTVFGINSLTTPVYQVSTTLLINQAPSSTTTPDYNSLLFSERLAKTYKELLKKRPLLTTVIQKLKLDTTEEELAKRINVDIVRDTLLMVLSVEDTKPQQAALIANTLAKEFNLQNQDLQSVRYLATKQSIQEEMAQLQANISQTQASLDALKTRDKPEQAAEESRLQTSLTQYRNSYANLLKSFEDVRFAEAQATSSLSVVEEASIARKIRPTIFTSTIIAGVIALFLAIGLALVVEYLDDSVKLTEQIEHLIGATTLGIISRIKGSNFPDRLITFTNPSSPIAEAYRVLRANIEFSEVDSPIQTILVTSTNPREGKSITVANLAVAIAQTGKKVIVVDTDLRLPSLHRYFELSNARGVTSALLEQNSLVSDYLVSTEIENLRVLPSGVIPPNPAELIGSKRMGELIAELKTLADVVIFDSSPILPVVDPTLLARYCDATLLVVNYRKTRSGALKKAYNQFQQSGTRLLGTILNNVLSENSAYYYYAQDNGKKTGGKRGKGYNKSKRLNRNPGSSKLLTPAVQPVIAETDRETARTKPKTEREFAKSSEIGQKENTTGINGEDYFSRFPAEIDPGSPGTQKTGETAIVATSTPVTLGILKVTDGPCSGLSFKITATRTLVGRVPVFNPPNTQPVLDLELAESETARQSKYSDIPGKIHIEDEKVSREHIEITFTQDGTFLRDLGSLNGTWLNGQKLNGQRVRLESNDKIQLGYKTKLQYLHING